MRFICIVLAVLAAGLAFARDAAGAGDWVEAQSLRELPAGVQVLLGVGLAPGAGGIADRGERFGATDAIVSGAGAGDGLHRRRFALGMVGANTALVAEERGGLAYSVRAVEYRRTGETWEAARCASLFQPPQRAAELLEAFAGRAGRGPVPCSRFDSMASAPFQPLRPRPGA